MDDPPTHQGWLYKRGEFNESWQKRFFLMKNGALAYYKSPKDSDPKGTILLEGARIATTTEKLRKKCGFELTIPGSTRIYYIHASFEEEMKEWIGALESAVRWIDEKKSRLAGAKAEAKAAESAQAKTTTRRASLLGSTQALSASSASSSSSSSTGVSSSASAAASQASLSSGLVLDTLDEASFGDSRRANLHANLCSIDDFRRKAGVLSSLSTWRHTLALGGQTNAHASLVSVSKLQKKAHLATATCMAIHNASDYMAIGGSTPSNQVFIVASRQSSANARRRNGSASGASLHIQQSFAQGPANDRDKSSTCSISWVDDKMLCSTSAGKIYLYERSPAHFNASNRGAESNSDSGDDDDDADERTSSNLKATFVHQVDEKSMVAVKNPAPGDYAARANAISVRLNPSDPSSFLSIANCSFALWHVDRPNPLHNELGSTAPLLSCAWNSHSPQEFILGGARGSLKLLDSRLLAESVQKCVVWKAPDAHDGLVRQVAWSPLFPHWVASAGSDGLAKVWDLRYGRTAVRVLSGHTNTVHALAWSRTHCEVILTGSTDRTVKLWNLRVSPHFLTYTSQKMSSDVCSVAFSSMHPHHFYSLSSSGEACWFQQSEAFVTQFVCHASRNKSTGDGHPGESVAAAASSSSSSSSVLNEDAAPGGDGAGEGSGGGESGIGSGSEGVLFPDEASEGAGPLGGSESLSSTEASRDDAAEKDIERLLYVRDFQGAFKAISVLADKYYAGKSNNEGASELLKLTSSTMFKQLTRTPPAVPESVREKTFMKLVEDLSRVIPERILTLSVADRASQQRIQLIKLHLTLVFLIDTKKWQDILALEKDICAHLLSKQSSPHFDAKMLDKIVWTILPHNHLLALQFALQIGQALRDADDFRNFFNIAQSVFAPSIYDSVDSNSDDDDDDYDGDVCAVSSAGQEGRGASRSKLTGTGAMAAAAVMAVAAGMTTGGGSSASAEGSRGSELLGATARNAQTAAAYLDRELRNPKVVLGQMELMLDLFSLIVSDATTEGSGSPAAQTQASQPAAAMWNPFNRAQAHSKSSMHIELPKLSTDASRKVIKVMDNTDHRKIIPVLAHRIYFHALLQQKHYDKVFILATRLVNDVRGSSFQNSLVKMMDDTAFPRFKAFLNQSLLTDAAQPWLLNRLITGTLTTINILYNSSYLPGLLHDALPEYLDKFANALKEALFAMRANKNYVPTSGKTGDADAKEKAQQLLSQIDRLQENRRSEVVLFDDDVHRLKNVLSRAVTPSWLQGSFKDNPPK